MLWVHSYGTHSELKPEASAFVSSWATVYGDGDGWHAIVHHAEEHEWPYSPSEALGVFPSEDEARQWCLWWLANSGVARMEEAAVEYDRCTEDARY